MDIRNFFSAKKKGGKNSAKQKKKQEIEIDDESSGSETDNEPKVNTVKRGRLSKQKESKKKNKDHVDISAQDYFSKAAPKKKKKTTTTAPPPKQRSIDIDIDSSDDEDLLDVFEKNEKKRSVNKVDQQEEEESPPLRTEKKRRLANRTDKLDADAPAKTDPKKKSYPKRNSRARVKPSIQEDDSSEEMYNESEEEPPESRQKKRRLQTRQPEKTTPPKKPKRTARATATSKSKKPQILEPGPTLDAFDTSTASSECLEGKTFVFTGVLDGLDRNASTDFIKELGGRVTSAVSGRTSYLVVGPILEDGRPYTEGSKYKKAQEVGTKIVMGEKQLYGLCQAYSDLTNNSNTTKENSQQQKQETSSKKASAPVKNPYAKQAVSNPYAKKSNPYAAKTNPYAKSKSASTEQKKMDDPTALWADKHAPKDTREILGNKDIVAKLENWLSSWERNFNSAGAMNKSFSAPGGLKKAVLLSGPPGIGKTTTATLVAKESGRETMEMNASDARSKKALSEGLGDVTGSQVLNFNPVTSSNKKKPAKVKRCIIMDEVDGMGAGDRSGMAELIKMIKNSRVPIICICNDRQSQKIKSLATHCLDLKYRRPTKSVIARRAVRIGQMEGLKVEQNAAEAIVESCGNDIRQVLNCMQMWANDKENDKMTYKDVKQRERGINKDEILRVSMFDACKMIIEGRKGLSGADAKTELNSLYKRSDAFFVDYSLMGLNVHQNYLKLMNGQYSEAVRSKDDEKMNKFVSRMHDATLAMSDFAMAEHSVRSGDQNWSLLPFCAMMAVKTGYHCGGEAGGFFPGFPEFAGWMGKNSARTKKKRLLQELAYHMNYKVSGDTTQLRLHYLPFLRDRFMSILKDTDNKAETANAIALMDDYGLDRDDIFENLDEFVMDPSAKKLADLDSKQKAAFTREYNKGVHKSQALVAEQGMAKKSRKSKKTPSNPDPADLDAVNDDKYEGSDSEDEEEDTQQLQELFKKKNGNAKSGSGKGKAKSGKGRRKSK